MTEIPKEHRARKSNRKVFTEENVRTLRKKKRQYMVWDGSHGRGTDDVARGLGILVSPSGTMSYRSTYYFPGSPKSHSRHLGRVGELALEEARRLCRLDRANARQGIDPKSDNPSKSDSYKAAVDHYVDHVQIGENERTSAEQARRVLLADVEDWWQRPIATIRPQEIYARLLLVRDGDDNELKPRPYLANLIYARMRPFFDWCANPLVGKIKLSPLLGIKKPWKGGTRRERDWFKGAAADQAVKTLWRIADEFGGTEGQYIKVLLLTGKRKTALADMRWEHVEPNWFWDPPQTGAKNKRLHGVPLSGLVQRILHPRQQRGYVFPGSRNGRIAADQRLQKKIIDAGAPADFFYHGVRHLAETKLAELKVQTHIRDRLLDHVEDRGSGKTYDHHEYRDEMLAAMEQWSEYVASLVRPQGAALLR